MTMGKLSLGLLILCTVQLSTATTISTTIRSPTVTVSPCYDASGEPQRCAPEFGRIARDQPIEATSTCGLEKPSEYCIDDAEIHNVRKCVTCSASTPSMSHVPSFLTDNPMKPTWWQSETMVKDVDWPNRVNLTLYLKKPFDISYISLKFKSPRPENLAIYKKTFKDGPWIPFQYYSRSCTEFYGLADSHFDGNYKNAQYYPFANRTEWIQNLVNSKTSGVAPDAIINKSMKPVEEKAFCTSEFSDISPLTGGYVLFMPLQGRPSAYNFDSTSNPALREWVTATAIRVSLDKLNTFGDEIFGDEQVLKGYYYAISDFSVGGRCKCNGHANKCEYSTEAQNLVCKCEHNTTGPNCEECLPFYNDKPWGPATSSKPHQCQACNCNGFSNECYFDAELYNATGHGGHCVNCRDNRTGPNCELSQERCADNSYMDVDVATCVPCGCNKHGSKAMQCGQNGKCQCKPGVYGDKCSVFAGVYPSRFFKLLKSSQLPSPIIK